MFLRFPSRKSAVPLRAILPNMITSAALACGLAGLHFAMNFRYEQALIAIALSAVFDALDGRAARLLHVTSRFGAVLDSLSDFASFGIAPAVVLYQWMLRDPDTGGRPALPHTFEPLFMLCVLTYAMCAAMRLARFTSAKPAKKSNPLASRFFVGMPTPAAALAVLIPVLLDVSPTVKWQVPPLVVAGYILAIGLLMVSRRPMFSFKKVRVQRGLVLPLFLAVGVLVLIAFKDPWLATAILAASYLATLPVSHVAHAKARAQMLDSEAARTAATVKGGNG